MSKEFDIDKFLLKRANQGYTFEVSSCGLFTNNAINSNLDTLTRIFSGNHWFDEKKEFVATNKDEILADALITCVAVAIDLESLNVRLTIDNDKKEGAPYKNIPDILFPNDIHKKSTLEQYIKEIFVVRDAIVHSHIHEVKVTMRDFKPVKTAVKVDKRALPKQGTDTKYVNCVSLSKKKTVKAELNVTLPKVSLLDVLKMLVILDLVNKYQGDRFLMIFQLTNKNKDPLSMFDYEKRWKSLKFDLTYIILHFINRINPNSYVHIQLKKFVKKIQKDFSDLPHEPFKIYRLYKYSLWDDRDFLSYSNEDFTM